MFFDANMSELAVASRDFRRVMATGPNSQLLTMSLSPMEDIGRRVHPVADQVLFIVSGQGNAVLNGKSRTVRGGDAVLVPAGVECNLANVGSGRLAVVAVCSPPQFVPDAVHSSKAEALEAEHDPAFPDSGGLSLKKSPDYLNSRTSNRVRVLSPATLRRDGQQLAAFGTVVFMNSSGLYLATQEKIQPGEEFDLSLSLPGHAGTFHARARVVTVRDARLPHGERVQGAGCAFIDAAPALLNAIQSLLPS